MKPRIWPGDSPGGRAEATVAGTSSESWGWVREDQLAPHCVLGASRGHQAGQSTTSWGEAGGGGGVCVLGLWAQQHQALPLWQGLTRLAHSSPCRGSRTPPSPAPAPHQPCRASWRGLCEVRCPEFTTQADQWLESKPSVSGDRKFESWTKFNHPFS